MPDVREFVHRVMRQLGAHAVWALRAHAAEAGVVLEIQADAGRALTPALRLSQGAADWLTRASFEVPRLDNSPKT